MRKGTKIAIYVGLGLGLLAGIYFGTRAIIRKSRLSDDEQTRLKELLEKSKNGTITPIEQDELDRIQGKKDDKEIVIDTDPDDDYEGATNKNQRVCSFPLGNASGNPNGCKQVAQLQLAINQTTNNMNDEAPNDYYCNNFEEGDGPLMVDGVMGARTLTAVKAYYLDDCCTCYMIGADNCTGCKITKSQFDAITNMEGADVSDEALAAAGWVDSTSNFAGFSLPQYGPKYSSPLGDFYKQQYAFTDDYPKQSNYMKSYGLGKGYGFSGQQTERTSTITLQEYIDDVP
tara:strand:+ start:181 stop:1041 length:861 start_codon:yes stop_codon:yes gene_type:complete